jgi:hypothetical protein
MDSVVDVSSPSPRRPFAQASVRGTKNTQLDDATISQIERGALQSRACTIL